MIVQGLSRPLVEFAGDAVEILLAVHGQIGSFREVLPQQAIGVLVRAALPGAVGVTEIHLDVRGQAQLPVIGKFLAPVPGQRPAQLARQEPNLPDERSHDAAGVLVGNSGQKHISGAALHQRCDVAVPRTPDQIALPMAGNGAILNIGGTPADRDRIPDLPEPVMLEAGVPGSADRALGAQMGQQFLLQNAARLDEQASIDRLV